MSATQIAALVMAMVVILVVGVFIFAALMGYIDRGKRRPAKAPFASGVRFSYFEIITLRRFIEKEWINMPDGPTRDNLMSILDKINVELSK